MEDTASLAPLFSSSVSRFETGNLLTRAIFDGRPCGGREAGESLLQHAGIDYRHVPYKGSAPAINDLLGNQIPMMFDPLQSVIHHITAGKLRALAVSGHARSPVLPDVPTMAEAGLAGFETTAWWAVFAPAGLSAAITARLQAEFERIVSSPAFSGKFADLGVVPSAAPLSLAQFQKTEIVKWGKAVQDSGAQVN